MRSNALDHVRRCVLAAVGDHVDRGEHLDHVDVDALPERRRRVLRIAHLFRGRWEQAALTSDVDAARLREPERLQVVVEGGMALRLHRFYGADVPRVREYRRVVDVAVVAPVPVVDAVTADADHAGVVDHRVGGDRAGVDGAGQGHDLHHRAWLVHRTGHAVLEECRVSVVEVVGVVARIVGPGDDATCVRVHDQHAAALGVVSLHTVGQRLLGCVLDVRVDRKHQILAVDRVLVRMRAKDDLAIGEVTVARDIAGGAGEDLLVFLLESVIALAAPIDKTKQVGGQRRSRRDAG